jgi:chromosome segregation ATPase
MQTSSLNVVHPESRNSLEILMMEADEHETSSGLDEFHWLMYLKRCFLAINHQADETDDDIALFLNDESDNIVNFIESIESRSIAKGFVTLGREVRALFHKLQQAEVCDEHQKVQLDSCQQQLHKVSMQYRELKEQLLATSSFSKLSNTRASLPTISFSEASAVRSEVKSQDQRSLEESRVEKERLQGPVDKLQNELLIARRVVAEIRRQSAEEARRAEALEQQLEEAGQTFASEMQVFAEEQRKAIDEAKTPATGQEERVSEHQEQISSLKTQLQEMQQMLQQVQQQHQVEVSDLQEQLERRTGQVCSDTQTEVQDAQWHLTERQRRFSCHGPLVSRDGGKSRPLNGRGL